MKKFIITSIILLGIYGNIKAQGFGCNTYTSNGVGFNKMANFGTFDFSQNCVPRTSRVSPFGFQSFAPSGTAINQHDAGHVNGYVKFYGQNSFTFPVGSGTDLRNLSISGQTASTDAYATAWIVGDPTSNGDPSNGGAMHAVTSVTTPIISVSVTGQWDWLTGTDPIFSGTTGTGGGVNISASIPDLTAFASAANLRLVGWNGTSWVDLSGSATATGNAENNLLSGTMIAGIQAIGVGSIASVLPVSVISFEGRINNCVVDLAWKTAEEINFAQFEIERKNNSNNNFIKIAAADAKGSNSTYTFSDNTALKGINLYRLKMINKDGGFTYTPIVNTKINCVKANSFIVFPNPVSNIININGLEGGQTIQLYNSIGQLLTQAKAINSTLSLNVSKYKKGTYLLVINNNEERVFTQKLIKTK